MCNIRTKGMSSCEFGSTSQVVLIYFNIRGKLQPIRNLLAYLEVPYTELHVEEKHTGQKIVKLEVRQVVKEVLKEEPIDSSQLPLLLHDGHKVYDAYPIMAYLCRRFSREDLMGRTIQQRARLLQILTIYFMKQPANMGDLFLLADQCYGKKQLDVLGLKSSVFQHLIKFSGYIQECCHLLQQHHPQTFILEELTLIDFTFLETSHYFVGFLGDLGEGEGKGGLNPENLKYLKVMQRHIQIMRNQPFYIKNREYLESKTLLSFLFSQQRREAISTIWKGEASMIK